MCEWLACGDWCDVRLMCGGRFFNAHRAVLASVSSFLRRMLLSCPVDESPIFIILPEFDLDAMSSVLYYIYNGEVWIPNHKIHMFFDIVNAMKIFIDQQYIHQISDYKQYYFEPKRNYNICQLRLCKGINECFINVRKGMKSEELIRQMQERDASLEACDKFNQTFRWSEENIPDVGNLISLSRYQQRQSFLRDIFLETVRYKGNANGQTHGVLAISNEEYHAQTSGLFRDIIVNYPSECKTISESHKKTLAQNNPKTAIFDLLKQLHDKDYMVRNKGNISISYTACNQVFNNVESILENKSNKEHNIDLWKTCTPLEISLPLLSSDSSNFPIKSQHSFLNPSHTKATSDVNPLFEVSKVTILNEVLQSPWHPRQPHSYRPFRKKDLNSVHVVKTNENKANVISKDNNNINDKQVTTDVRIVGEVSSVQEDLRCVVCQEVFTIRQDYTIHMRQHSSINRYSCGECQKTFSQLRNYKYHMSVHRGTKEFAATCSVCGKHFNDRGYLSNHMKIHRNRKEYKCASCPKSFNQRVAFNMHVRIHTGVKPHVCEECGKAFSRKMLLKQHQRTHSGERPYGCTHCDKRFADRSNMTLHLRLHTGVKPFSCTLCSKSFTKKHHLKSHLNFHTGSKPYSCPRCKLAFTQSSNMRTHYKKCNVTI